MKRARAGRACSRLNKSKLPLKIVRGEGDALLFSSRTFLLGVSVKFETRINFPSVDSRLTVSRKVYSLGEEGEEGRRTGLITRSRLYFARFDPWRISPTADSNFARNRIAYSFQCSNASTWKISARLQDKSGIARKSATDATIGASGGGESR